MARPWSTQPMYWRALGAAVIAMVGLTAVVVHASGGEHGAHGGSLDLNWWAWDGHAPPIGWFLVDFALFVSGLVYVAAKPLSQAFAQRHLSIKRAITEASAAHAKATARRDEVVGKLASIEAETAALLKSSEVDGAAEREQIVRDAQEYAARLLQESGSIAAQEVQRAQGRLRRTVLSAALRQAQERLLQDITETDKQRLLEQSIVELENISAPEATRQGRRNTARASGTGGLA